MANVKNLKPIETLSREEAKRRGSKGGKASVEAKRKRKAMKEQLEILLKLPLKDKIAKQNLKDLGIGEDNIDNQMLITASLFQEALKGNTKAYELIRDTLGEKPRENINIENPHVTKVLDSINNQLKGK